MTLTFDEVRMLLGMCVRGLRDIRDDETSDLDQSGRMEIQDICDKVEEAYDGLYPFAPDVGDIDGE